MRRILSMLLVSALLLAAPAALAKEETGVRTIVFAGGCFWGLEKLMSLVPGVTDAVSGYANGQGDCPSYEQVCTGTTGYREAVKVSYDPERIGLKDLLRLFFEVIDPTVKDRQANDIGSQYQTGVYWVEAEDQAVVEAAAEGERRKHEAFHVELQPLTAFCEAEEYHQDYLVKNPFGYCHIGPKDFELAKKLKKLGD